MAGSELQLSDINTTEDVAGVAAFLQRELNPRISSDRWSALMRPPWGAVGPHRGVQLVAEDGRVVGAYVAVHSVRQSIASPICNLAAFCIEEQHRPHSLRLVRALLRQKRTIFTDLSPSGSVPALNSRLGFQHLDTTTSLTLNLPTATRGPEMTERSESIEEMLSGSDAQIFRDHRDAPAARHILIRGADEYAYLMYRRDRRKNLPVFASPLYVGGSRQLLRDGWPVIAQQLLRRGMVATLAERRVLGFVPSGPSRQLRHPRPKMYRGGDEAEVDYLYSELVLLEW